MNYFEAQKLKEDEIIASAGTCKFCGAKLLITPDRKLWHDVASKYGEAKVKIGCFHCGIFVEVKSWDTQKNSYAETCEHAIRKWHRIFRVRKKDSNGKK